MQSRHLLRSVQQFHKLYQEIYISFEGISHILDEVEKARRRLIANVNFEVAIEMLLVTIKENGKVW